MPHRPHNSPLESEKSKRTLPAGYDDDSLEASMMSSSLMTRDGSSMVLPKTRTTRNEDGTVSMCVGEGGSAAAHEASAAEIADSAGELASAHHASAGLTVIKDDSPGSAPELLPQRTRDPPSYSSGSDTGSPVIKTVSRLTRHTTVAKGKPVPTSPLEDVDTLAVRVTTHADGSGMSADEVAVVNHTKEGAKAARAAASASKRGAFRAATSSASSTGTETSASESGCSDAGTDADEGVLPPIDEAAATRQFGSAKMFQMMLKRFASYLPDSVQKLQAAFEGRDFATLHAEGHSLKGSSSFIAAKRLCKVATAMQDICRQESVDASGEDELLAEVGSLMTELTAAAAAVMQYLEAGGGGTASSAVKKVKKDRKKKKKKDKDKEKAAAKAEGAAATTRSPENSVSPAMGAAAMAESIAYAAKRK